MGKGPLISIIVPIYNVEEYLSDCVASIMQQTYKNLQIILVDDGSTDKSGKICDNLAKTDGRIRVIHKENGGLVSARKTGLSFADGVYIGFVDGDDFINEDMYEEMVDNLVSTKADFVHTGYYRGALVASQLKDNLIDISKNRSAFINDYILSLGSRQTMSPSIWSKLFKAELIKKSYMEVPEKQSFGEDLINLIICALHSSTVSLLDSSYYHYRVRSTSMTHEKTKTALLNCVRLFESLEAVLKKHGCYEQAKDALANDWLGIAMCSSLRQASGDDFKVQCFGIRNMELLIGKRIVLYGAGSIGKDYYSQIRRYPKCELVAWVDENYQNIHYDCIDVMGKEVLDSLDFDILIIAVMEEQAAKEIRCSLAADCRVEEGKIIWIEPTCSY